MATEINLENDDVTVNTLTATGNITANAFEGDGSLLTGISGGGSATLEACKAFLSADSTVNDSTNFTDKNVFPNTAGLDINIGSFTSASDGIDVPSTGLYIVMGNMVYSSTVVRANPEWRFTINGTGQSESSRSAYIRSGSGHNSSSASLTTIYNLTAGQRIGLEFRQEGAAGTVDLENTSHVAIYRIA